ncbi:MAG: MCE family protein [Myxococcales bacterium]|nr:MCE family protein [Myxococcales bacterium]
MASERTIEIRVGVFLISALFLAGLMIFIVGSANRAFDKQVSVYASFENVAGLSVGSLVTLSGFKIGVVDKIWLMSADEKKVDLQREQVRNKAMIGLYEAKKQAVPKELLKTVTVNPRSIRVRMKIDSSILSKIRLDSVANVKGKGLLGDSLVDISIGTEGATLKADGDIQGETPKGMSEILVQVKDIAKDAGKTVVLINDILGQYKDQKLTANIKGIVGSVDGMMARVRSGPGLAHDLLFSKSLSNSVQGSVVEVRRTIKGLADTGEQVSRFLRRAQRPGTLLHRLLLSKQGRVLLTSLEDTVKGASDITKSLNTILAAPRKRGTLLNKLLFDPETSQILTNLNRSSEDIRTILRDIRNGKGSLGALINDPTAFEDFKAILGQVKRSRIFRSLIRLVISRDESKKGGLIIRQ